jgi:UDP-N-acetylglucosamine--N-acetylmuramyl-(pentapeptide) pyrophosphoryl-undecaprenol N-acetylglucosamine transferase
MSKIERALFACGGTGGHIFPAIALADELKTRLPRVNILFVGAENGMENTLVPRAGYPLSTLPIAGLHRRRNLKNLRRNLTLPYKLAVSFYKSHKILKDFRPNVVVGTGGYASFPVLRTAAFFPEITTAIQEQNAFPGLSNRILGRTANAVFLGDAAAEKYFPAKKCHFTGNPVRVSAVPERETLREKWGVEKGKTVLLVTGGSLGAAAINRAVARHLDEILARDVHLIWQTGKLYYERYAVQRKNVTLLAFVDAMAEAYTLADAVVSRAGALTLAELALYRKPALLIPSPNVADDHQRHNAESRVRLGAARMILETEIEDKFLPALFGLLDARASIAERLAALPQKHSAAECIDLLMALHEHGRQR